GAICRRPCPTSRDAVPGGRLVLEQQRFAYRQAPPRAGDSGAGGGGPPRCRRPLPRAARTVLVGVARDGSSTRGVREGARSARTTRPERGAVSRLHTSFGSRVLQ